MHESNMGLVNELVDALEDRLNEARAVPLSSSVLVNRFDLLSLLSQLRSVLPSELSQAVELVAGESAARAAAQVQADELLADARSQAARLVEHEAVVVAAQQRAEQIAAQAQAAALQLRREADDYCDRRLEDLENDLSRAMNQVQAGRARLSERFDD